MRLRSAPVRVRPAHPAARVLALVRWYRRPLAFALLALALVPALGGRTGPAVPTVTVLTAVRDLAAGSALDPADLVPTAVPRALAPDGAIRAGDPAWAGRVVALPVRRGEVVTDVRLLDVSLLDRLTPAEALPGQELVAVVVRPADPASTAPVRVGDVIDVLGAGESGAAHVAASAARVLAIAGETSGAGRERSPAPLRGSPTATGDGVLVVAVTPTDALALARAAALERLSVLVRRAVR